MRAIGWAPLLACTACATASGLADLHESECVAPCDSGSAADATTDVGAPSGDESSIDVSSDDSATTDGPALDSGDDAGDGSGGSDGSDGASQDSPSDGPSVRDASDGGPVQPGGLLYYFPLAGDANDYSGHNHNANVVNNVTFTTGRTGKANGAAIFNGTSSYMSAPGTALPVGATPRTLTVWLNPSTSTSQFGVVYWGKNNCMPAGSMFGLGIGLDNTTMAPKPFWGGCDDVGMSGPGIPMGKWTFAAAAFTPPNQLRLFVNATAMTYTLGAALNTPASMFWIGAETTTDSAGQITSHFAGAIESIRVYDHALTDADVAVVMALP